MVATPCRRHDPAVVEVLIGFDRPESLSESDMRDWIDQRARAGRPALTLGRTAGTTRHHLLWVRPSSDSSSAAGDQVADLILDMRLLGFRPTLMADAGGSGLPAHEQWPEDG
jgi:hypothetical protein